MTFTQALARIEELLKTHQASGDDHDKLHDLLCMHADSIVQLGKVAGEMRKQHTLHYYSDDHSKPWAAPSIYGCIFKLGKAAQEYDKLMNGEEG